MTNLNDWDRKSEELRTAMRAILASLLPRPDAKDAALYDRAKMLESLIMLEQMCSHMEVLADAHRHYGRSDRGVQPVPLQDDSFYTDDGEGEDKCANWKPIGAESDTVPCSG